MTKKFLTETEIEESLERFHATLRDSKGQPHLVEAASLTWRCFLMLTCTGSLTSETIIDGVLQWQKEDYPNQEINFLFAEYVALLANTLAPETINSMEEEFKRSSPESHPLFNKIYGTKTEDRQR